MPVLVVTCDSVALNWRYQSCRVVLSGVIHCSLRKSYPNLVGRVMLSLEKREMFTLVSQTARRAPKSLGKHARVPIVSAFHSAG